MIDSDPFFQILNYISNLLSKNKEQKQFLKRPSQCYTYPLILYSLTIYQLHMNLRATQSFTIALHYMLIHQYNFSVEKTLSRKYAYNVVAFLKPQAPQDDIDYVVNLVTSAIQEFEGQVYSVESGSRDLYFKISEQATVTALVVSWTGLKATANAVQSKLKYKECILRYEVFSDKEKHEAMRLEDAPLNSSASLHCLNPALQNCLSETGNILPRKFTKLSPKLQRKMSRAVKSARKFGLCQI